MEVSSEVRKRLMQQKRIKLGWNICNIDDYIAPVRCFKCSRYNHKHPDCQGEETCPLCTGKHKLKECTASQNEFKCINCMSFNQYNKNDKITENDSSLDKSCPNLITTIRKYKENIDY